VNRNGLSVDDEDSVPGIGARRFPPGSTRWHAACIEVANEDGLQMYNVMITVLELAAGVGLAGALVAVTAILVALELGRLVSRDDEQREVTTAAVDEPRCRAAA